jgi:RNA polymerase sigma-70 factor, ECF subfamily
MINGYTCNVKPKDSSQRKTVSLKTSQPETPPEAVPKVGGSGEQYFFEMFERYQDPIFRFLYFRVNDRAVALDITQDTFTKTWNYLANGKTIEYEEAFLYRTAKNALIDYFKKSKSYSLDSMMDSGFDPRSDEVEEKIIKNDDIDTIQNMVKDLDEESKQIIYLRFGEEKPIEEIAKVFGKSTNAMTVQIHRIIKKLRATFTDSQNYGT